MHNKNISNSEWHIKTKFDRSRSQLICKKNIIVNADYLRAISLAQLPIKTLDLSNNSIKADSIDQLIPAKWNQLTKLLLQHNPLANEGIISLSKCTMPHLSHLQLRNCKIGPIGVKFMIRMDLPYLFHLSLGNNLISSEGVMMLVKGRHPKLVKLNLYGNKITNQAMKSIICGNCKNLSEILLDNNQIDQTGFTQLVKANWQNLTYLGTSNYHHIHTLTLQQQRILNSDFCLSNVTLNLNRTSPRDFYDPIFNLIVTMLAKTMRNLVRLPFSTLTRLQAVERAQIIKKNTIDYSCHLTLHKGLHYNGLTSITFETNQLNTSVQNLHIDFQGKQVVGLMINDQILTSPHNYHRDGVIRIPKNLLKSTQTNNIVVRYSNDYDKDGNGCVSFIDVDGKQYLYTQFQPYFANRVFPIFDQPDLKAPLTLTLACPNEWQAVLSNEFTIPHPNRLFTVSGLTQSIIAKYLNEYRHFVGQYQNQVPTDYKTTSFTTTKLLPSYLYCFVVGSYKQLPINLSKKVTKVPMNLYSIQSLYPQMQALAPYIEQITVQAMQFFQKYFGYAYPFSKYDQVFAHQYKWGAMQNAGIVTLNDLYLFKDKVSNQKMLSFGNTIVHELAHHWFGNLVTMKWWDDLWLNQSFAQYISHFCLQKIKGNLTTITFESAMLSFLSRKGWGYSQDEMVTTHPIRSEVEDTSTAESIFDGITYSKGAATMKQLMYLLGEDSFSQALKYYFNKYEFSNAVLDDLLAALQPHFDKMSLGFSLNQWKQMWLQTAGTNVLQCQWQPNTKTARIIQTLDRSQCPTLRVHRIKVGLIQKSHITIEREVLVLPQKQTQVILDIPQQTVAVLLNYQDLTFAKVELDSKSREYFARNLSKVQNVLSRAIVWREYFNMLKDCKISSNQFVEFVVSNLAFEKSDPIFQEQIGNVMSAIHLYTPKSKRQPLYRKVHGFIKKLLLTLQDNQANRNVILRDKLIDFSNFNQARIELGQWYWGKPCQLSSQLLNNTLRWKIVVKLFGGKTISTNQKWELFEDMKSKDSSDTMINKRFTCQALAADDSQLQKIYKNLFNKDNSMSVTNAVNQMRGFNSQIHKQIIKKQYFLTYFSDVDKYLLGNCQQHEVWFRKGDYLQNFIVHMDPICEDSVVQLQLKISHFKELRVVDNDKIKRILLKKIDLLQRRKRAYLCFNQETNKIA